MFKFFKFFKLVKSFVNKENISMEDLINKTSLFMKIISSFKEKDDFYNADKNVFNVLNSFQELSKEEGVSFESLSDEFRLFIKEKGVNQKYSEEKTRAVLKDLMSQLDFCRNSSFDNKEEFMISYEKEFIKKHADKINLDVKITFARERSDKKFYIENGSLIHFVAHHSLFYLLNSLLEKGINVKEKDALGRTAIDVGFTLKSWGKDKTEIFNNKLEGTHPNSEYWHLLYEKRLLGESFKEPNKEKVLKI